MRKGMAFFFTFIGLCLVCRTVAQKETKHFGIGFGIEAGIVTGPSADKL